METPFWPLMAQHDPAKPIVAAGVFRGIEYRIMMGRHIQVIVTLTGALAGIDLSLLPVVRGRHFHHAVNGARDSMTIIYRYSARGDARPIDFNKEGRQFRNIGDEPLAMYSRSELITHAHTYIDALAKTEDFIDEVKLRYTSGMASRILPSDTLNPKSKKRWIRV